MEAESTFDSLLEKHRTVVERYINFRMRSRYDADDVIQETYLAAFRHFEELKNIDSFKPWILTIAKNQCLMWYRKNSYNKTVSIETLGDVAEVTELVYDDTVSSILAKLPREVAQLLRWTMDGYKQAEIAEKLGIPLGTVKSRLYYAKRMFRDACPSEILSIYERGKKSMAKKDYTFGFPGEMPMLSITKKDIPFFEVKFEEESFIIPKVGNKNSEGTYRYPQKKLALVSTCYVPKKAFVHDIECVKICRDTYNVAKDSMYKNECVWFTQLTDEYIRDLAVINDDSSDDFPTYVATFFDDDFDVLTSGKDRVHGRPVVTKENPVTITTDGICADNNVRYTDGVYDVTIGERKFETIKLILLQGYCLTESYVDRNGRLVLLRWYERTNEIYSFNTITVNGNKYSLVEDRIGEYAM